MSEGIALEGIRLVKDALPRVVKDGTDLAARADMMSAAMMGAVAFQKGLGAIHALSHPVGALYGTHHGMTNAVFMPYVLAFNRPAVEEKLVRLARFLAIDGGAAGVLRWVVQLRQETGVPNGLTGLGVDGERFETIADMAVVDPTAGGNPVPIDRAAALSILSRALQETLDA